MSNQKEQVQRLQSRLVQLSDRVSSLEVELKDTQTRVQHDVKRLADLLVQTLESSNKTLIPPVR